MNINYTTLTTTFLLGSLGSYYLQKFLKKTLKFPQKLLSLPQNHQKTSKQKFCCNIISILHQIIMFTYAYQNIKSFNLEKKTDEIDLYFFSYSFGYYIYDTIFCYLSNYKDKIMYLHHFFMIFLTFFALYYKNFANVLINLYFIGEMTGPIFMIFENLEFFPKLKIFKDFLGFLFCSTFLFNRFFYGIGITLMIYEHNEIPLVLKFIVGIGVYISIFWTFRLVKEMVLGFSDFLGFSGLVFLAEIFESLERSKVFRYFYQVFCLGVAFFSLVFFEHQVILS